MKYTEYLVLKFLLISYYTHEPFDLYLFWFIYIFNFFSWYCYRSFLPTQNLTSLRQFASSVSGNITA